MEEMAEPRVQIKMARDAPNLPNRSSGIGETMSEKIAMIATMLNTSKSSNHEGSELLLRITYIASVPVARVRKRR